MAPGVTHGHRIVWLWRRRCLTRVSYILEILETWKYLETWFKTSPSHSSPMFFNETSYFLRNKLERPFWDKPFETNPEIRRDFEDGKPIESCEVIPSLIIENTGGHPRSHKMNKSNISTRVSGDWLKPWWKTATFFLSLQSVVSVYWRLWYRNYVQRSEGEVSKRMKITEKSIGINLINLIPSTFWGYPMLLLFVNFQFLSVKPGWSWLKTPCWVGKKSWWHMSSTATWRWVKRS